MPFEKLKRIREEKETRLAEASKAAEEKNKAELAEIERKRVKIRNEIPQYDPIMRKLLAEFALAIGCPDPTIDRRDGYYSWPLYKVPYITGAEWKLSGHAFKSGLNRTLMYVEVEYDIHDGEFIKFSAYKPGHVPESSPDVDGIEEAIERAWLSENTISDNY